MKRYLTLIPLLVVLLGCGSDETFVLNKVITPVPEVNNTTNVIVPVPDVEVTTGVEVNNTVIVQMNELPILGDGSFSDPFVLRQAKYTKLPTDEFWMQSNFFDGNCTVSGLMTSTSFTLTAMDDKFDPIGTEFDWPKWSFNTNSTNWVTLKIKVKDENSSMAVIGDCIDRPLFY